LNLNLCRKVYANICYSASDNYNFSACGKLFRCVEDLLECEGLPWVGGVLVPRGAWAK